MATTVYDVEEIELQDGSVVKLKPLSIKKLKDFMAEIQKTASSESEDATLTILIDACGIALESQLPAIVKDRDAFESVLDMPTIYRIIEVCGGIDLEDPNLLAAAVLAGQN